MKNLVIFFAIMSLAFGCKKKTVYQNCATCACFNVDTFNAYNWIYADSLIDSATFFQSLLGTWYVKQQDTSEGPYLASCFSQCLCDTQYYMVFLPNDSVIINLPHITRNTFPYSFLSPRPNKINPQSGTITIVYPSNIPFLQITYAGNYLGVSIEFPTPGTLILPPNYYLSRH